jgi:hypothetical protein
MRARSNSQLHRPGHVARWRGTTARLLVMATAALGLPLIAGASSAAAAGPCDAPVVNKVACENTKPGTPESEWRVDGVDDEIVGFTTDISTNVGGTVRFKVSSPATSWKIDIYRLGWYGGDGARLMGSIGNFGRSNVTASNQATNCTVTNATIGLVDCGNWAVSASWPVPTTAVSGLYYAVLHRNDTGGENEVPFVVRDDSSHSDVMFQTSDETWQAYNRYGGNSLYSGTGPGDGGSAYAVSYNRPIAGGGDENYIFNAEVPALRFLEANGYDLTYSTDVDADRNGALIKNHKVYMPVGHDEYWSAGQRNNVEAARAAGVSMAFLTGNEIFWKTRFDVSTDGTNTPYRTVYCYKETKANAKIDPSPQWTGSWRDPRFSPPADGGKPENGLLGNWFLVNGRRDDKLQVPAAYGKMRLWRNTPLATMASGTTYSFQPGTLGYEWNVVPDNGFQPAGVAQMSRTTVTIPASTDPDVSDQYILKDYGYTYGPGTATHAVTYYKDPTSGAKVFGAGTVQWAWGLDDYHAFETGTPTSDVRMKQATVNFLADMGAQPATRQAGLVAAAPSTDTTAPTVTIGTASPSPVTNSTPTTISGTVTDTGGQVAGVEVSVDGTSWHPAAWTAGTSTWTYATTPSQPGTLTVQARAVDDSLNLSAPVSKAFTIGQRDCPCSLWDTSTVPTTPSTNDANPYELGVKFQSAAAGYIRGVRFYKGTGNTGTHTGSLWSSTGQLLATGTFSNESATGWQTLTFPRAVQIQANTTYVASYHTNTGRYAGDAGYFASSAFTAYPLTALKDGTAGPNGVFKDGASGFPTQTFGAANYWVDVVFANDPGPDTQPPNVATTSPAAAATAVKLDAGISATFDEPVATASVQFAVKQGTTTVPGTVAMNADRTVATFTPSAALTAATTYTATVKATDDTGNVMPVAYSWSFTTGTPRPTGCPCMIFDGFSLPDNLNTNDASAIELGTKVRFDSKGFVTGVRFYKGSQNTGTHTGSLWTTAGTRLATGTFTGESASGWQTLTFATPVQVAANTTYVVSYHTNTGFYSSSAGYFANAGADYQALHALKDGVDGGNGVYLYGASGYPTGSYNSTNYWVDVLWTNSLTGDSDPPTVTGTTPAANATGVALTAAPAATFSEAVDPASIQFTVKDGGGAQLTGTISYNASTRTATFLPASKLAAGEGYTASVRAADADANLMANPVTWSFTTTTSQTCPCSLFSAATVPTTVSTNDGGSYELGVQFTSAVDGTVTGVKFYKGPGNSGPHTGSLWSSTGTLLATGTFSDETATGWQTLMFPTPVPITAGATYVASYTDPNGFYSSDSSYFEQGPAVSSPLTAPATGGAVANGVYHVGPGFPTSTFRGGNYWVDVIVTTP